MRPQSRIREQSQDFNWNWVYCSPNFAYPCAVKKAYKNELFQILLNHSLGIDNFDIIESGHNLAMIYKPFEGILKYEIFQERNDFDLFTCVANGYVPGFPRQKRNLRPENFYDVKEDFKRWLAGTVRQYIQDEAEIDLWAEYQKRGNLAAIKSEDYSDFSIFTSQEKDTIKLALNEIKELIAERFASTETQLQLVNDRIDYLSAGVDRLNKTDFKGIFINTIISIMIALSLDTQRGQELYNLFMQVIQFMPTIGN